jgi:hypothetical protein
MKNIFILLGVAVIFNACGPTITGNGNVHTEKRNTGDFSGVHTSGSIDVEITSGDSYAVSVEDDDNILPYIITEVEGGNLNVHYKNGFSINNDHAKVYVTAPSLDKIGISGSGNITTKNVVKSSNKIEVNTSGSGDLHAELDAPSVDADIAGSGNISLSGRTKDFSATTSGSGDFKCSDLQSENTIVDITGSGNAHVFASVHLKASVTGSGDVYYRGNPSSPETHITGSGSVQPEK